MDDTAFLDATAQAELVRSGDATPVELVEAAIARVEELNGELNAVIHPLFDKALDAARAASRAGTQADVPDGPFRGVPIVLKDHDGESAGDPVCHGMQLLKDVGLTGERDSFLFQRLRSAGFIPVGKTNTPELGLMPTTEPRAFGPTRNPWNTGHTPGGSSGGSAAAVASGMVPVGHAGDGGGSIRIPSSACGLFGLKPTRGRTSMGPDEQNPWQGLVVRHVLTRTVRDSAAVLDTIAGSEPGDPYREPLPERPFVDEVGADPGTLRVGLLTTSPLSETDPECVAAAEETGALLESLGHHVEPAVSDALTDASVLEHFVVIISSWVRADLDALGERIGYAITADDVEPMTGFYADNAANYSAAQYITGIEALHEWSRRVLAWWASGFDLLLTPTLAIPPPKIGELIPPEDNPLDGLVRQSAMAAYTGPFNMTGQPAASLPLSWTDDGLPVGSQLVAATGREDLLVRVSSQLEEARPWADLRPPVAAGS
ncbi:MAG: amidase [Acidimicrobiia bacterium]|nr:amidase [Acidimicrobiia bacterium]